MTNMTWNQFKQHIDRKLKIENISGDEEIWYIDISFPQTPDDGHNDESTNCPSVTNNQGIGLSIK